MSKTCFGYVNFNLFDCTQSKGEHRVFADTNNLFTTHLPSLNYVTMWLNKNVSTRNYHQEGKIANARHCKRLNISNTIFSEQVLVVLVAFVPLLFALAEREHSYCFVPTETQDTTLKLSQNYLLLHLFDLLPWRKYLLH